MKTAVAHASDQVIEEDFQKAQNLKTRLDVLSESARQLSERSGMAFSWVVPVASAMLGGVMVGLQWMDKHLPGVADGALALTGGMLGLVAVMGVLGTVAGPIKAGAHLLHLGGIMRSVFSRSALRLLVSPWLALPVLFGAALYDTYTHWERFRASLGRLRAAMAQIGAGNIWSGVKQAWDAVWGKKGVMEGLFTDFAEWVDHWTGGFATMLGAGITKALDAATPIFKRVIDGWKAFFEELGGSLSKLLHTTPYSNDGGGQTFVDPNGVPLTPPPALRHPSSYRLQAPGAAASVERASWDGTIHITADPGLTAKASSGDQRVRFTGASVDRGRMLGRA